MTDVDFMKNVGEKEVYYVVLYKETNQYAELAHWQPHNSYSMYGRVQNAGNHLR